MIHPCTDKISSGYSSKDDKGLLDYDMSWK